MPAFVIITVVCLCVCGTIHLHVYFVNGGKQWQEMFIAEMTLFRQNDPALADLNENVGKFPKVIGYQFPSNSIAFAEMISSVMIHVVLMCLLKLSTLKVRSPARRCIYQSSHKTLKNRL